MTKSSMRPHVRVHTHEHTCMSEFSVVVDERLKSDLENYTRHLGVRKLILIVRGHFNILETTYQVITVQDNIFENTTVSISATSFHVIFFLF